MKSAAAPGTTTWTWPQRLLIIWAISILLFRLLLVLLSSQVVTLPIEYRGGADFPVGLVKPTQSLLQPRVTATSSNMRSDVRLRLRCSKCGLDDDGHSISTPLQ
jgi:hypothetical protein